MMVSVLARAAARTSVCRPSLVRRLMNGTTTTQKTTSLSPTTTTIYKRHMVMVTQTKSSEPSELFPNNPDDHAEAPSPSTTSSTRKEQPSNTYETLSDVLTVTPSCLSRVEALIQQRAAAADTNGATTDYFLRVFVDAGGCSGFTYQFEVDSELDEDEDIVVIAAADTRPRIVVDETSLGFLQGSTLDYVQEMIKSSFVVAENPQSESACGCGSSFAVKNFSANPALD